MASIDENILEDDGDGYDYEYDDIDGEREKALLEDDDEYNDTQPDLILHEEDDLDEEEERSQNREHKFTTERNTQQNEQEPSTNFINQTNRVPFRKNFLRRSPNQHKFIRNRRIHVNPRFQRHPSPVTSPVSNNVWNAPAPRPWMPQQNIPVWNSPPPMQNVWHPQSPPLMPPPQFPPPPQVPQMNNHQWFGGNGFQNQNYMHWNNRVDMQYPQQFNQPPFCQNSGPVQQRLGFNTNKPDIFAQSHQSFPLQPPPQPQPQPVINFNNYAAPMRNRNPNMTFFPRKKFKPAAPPKEIMILQNICVKQQTNVVQQVAEPEVVDPKETDEEREYRIKIQEQKRLREKVLAEKERKRKLAAGQQPLEAKQPVVKQPIQQSRPPPVRVQEQFRPQQQQNANTTSIKGGIFNQRIVLPRSNNIHIQCVDSTSTFFNERTILAKDTTLPDTRLVVVKNLCDSTSNRNIIAMCKPIGDIEKLQREKSERQATILFKSVASAHAFYKKYQRYMLDLSMIEVLLKPE